MGRPFAVALTFARILCRQKNRRALKFRRNRAG